MQICGSVVGGAAQAVCDSVQGGADLYRSLCGSVVGGAAVLAVRSLCGSVVGGAAVLAVIRLSVRRRGSQCMWLCRRWCKAMLITVMGGTDL